MSANPTPYIPLSSDNATLVLVDHQIGLLTGVRDITVADATLAIEVLKDNSRPDAGAVYGALAMPFAVLVGQIAHAYGK
jgi:hypothetical protein